MTMIEQAADDLDGFDSSAGVMAYVYSKEGAEGLRALLATLGAMRETLERDAAELQQVGLPDVAQIVLEAASDAPPEAIALCPYDPEDRCNYQSWHAAYQRRQLRLAAVPLGV